MIDDLAKRRIAREVKQKFGDIEKLRSTVDQGLVDSSSGQPRPQPSLSRSVSTTPEETAWGLPRGTARALSPSGTPEDELW
jgi:hypothetical protein